MQHTDSSEQRSLAQIVTSWSPSQLQLIADEYSNSCKKVQTAFSGYDSYKSYFEPLLLAELAAELLSAIDKFVRAPVKRAPKVRSRREEPGTLIVRVAVKKVSNKVPVGVAVDLDPTDAKGPVGCGDGDIVALWSVENSPPSGLKHIPAEAVLAIGSRPAGKNGVRLIVTKFPDENILHNRPGAPDSAKNKPRIWFLLKLGQLTTIRREHQAILNIRASPLLPILLRPASKDAEAAVMKPVRPTTVDSAQAHAGQAGNQPPSSPQVFTGVVASKMGLNTSQTRAVAQSSMFKGGFTVIQGPPGTGKTRTLIALLNVIHMTGYQQYYEALLSSLEPAKRSSSTQNKTVPEEGLDKNLSTIATQGSLLETMMAAMDKTMSSGMKEIEKQPLKRLRRPRLLICAPSNSAVDEIVTRLMKLRFFDGQGRTYCPELARIGAGDRVSDSVKPYTAEGQAQRFLDSVCSAEMSADAQRTAQLDFLRNWQQQCNSLLHELQRTPKTPETRPKVIQLHEQLERMDRNLRRLKIAADDGKKKLSRDEKLRQLARTYVEDAQLVFSTLSGAGSNILAAREQQEPALFDTAIIDEAAQSTEPSSLIPLVLGAKRCILVGDPQQLPATVLASGSAGVAYGQSLLDRVCRAGKKVLLLDTQYRMHPAISSFPRRYFYEGNLVDDETVQGDHRAKPYHHDTLKPRLGPYVFLDVPDGEERRSYNDKSVFNPTEAELATQIYKKLKRDYGNDCIFSAEGKTAGSTLGFGVVTPYKSQMHALRQAFDRAGVPTGDVEIDTVDSYQGREKEVIIFSCVRTAINKGIGFVRDIRRMNVGLTRARSSLIVLGSAQALSEGSKDWGALVDDARSRGCLISVSDVLSEFGQPSASRPSAYQTNPVSSSAGRLGIAPIDYGSANVVAQTGSLQQQVQSDPRIRNSHPHQRSGILMTQTLTEGSAGTNGSRMTLNNGQGVTSRSRDNLQASNQHGETAGLPDSNIQKKLDVAIQSLKNSGADYNEETIQTLRNHLASGGTLEVETVMAAVIATTDRTGLRAESSMGDSKSLTNVVAAGTGSMQSLPHAVINSGSVPARGQFANQPSDKHVKNRDSKELRPSSPPRKEKKKRVESSGWAMAISKSGTSGEAPEGLNGTQKKEEKVLPSEAEEEQPQGLARHRTHPSRTGDRPQDVRENSPDRGRSHSRSPKRQRYRDDPRINASSSQSRLFYNNQGGGARYGGSADGPGQVYPQGNQGYTPDMYGQNMSGEYGMIPNMQMQSHGYQPAMQFGPGHPGMAAQGLTGPTAMHQHQQMMMHQAAIQQAHVLQQQGIAPMMGHPAAMPHAVGMHATGGLHQGMAMHPGGMAPGGFLPMGIMPQAVVPMGYPNMPNMGIHPGGDYNTGMQQFGNSQGHRQNARGRGQGSGSGRGRRGRGGRGRGHRNSRKRP